MRAFLLGLFLCVIATGCVKPIDLTIPPDHPANPQAVSSKQKASADYIYHLPVNGAANVKKVEKAGQPFEATPRSNKEGMNHNDHSSVSSEKGGKNRAH